MNKLFFKFDDSCEQYLDTLIKSAEHVSSFFCIDEAFSLPVTNISVINKFQLSQDFPFNNPQYAIGGNNDDEILIKEVLFNPYPLFKDKEYLLKDYSVQKSVNATFIHEFMEKIYRIFNPLMDAHDMLMHYLGDTKCVNNISLFNINENLSLDQIMILKQKYRADLPCKFHESLIKNYLLKFRSNN